MKIAKSVAFIKKCEIELVKYLLLTFNYKFFFCLEPSTSVENEEEKIKHAVGVIYNLDLSVNQYKVRIFV